MSTPLYVIPFNRFKTSHQFSVAFLLFYLSIFSSYGQITPKDSIKTKIQHIEKIGVQGFYAKQKLERSAIPVHVVDMQQFRGQSNSLVDVLNRTPGIKLRTDGAIGDVVNINLNGLDGKAVVLFKDGIPLNFYGHSFLPSLIPGNLLERVEVYKGALPIALGADALAGALNFVGYYPKEKTIRASYEIGSFGTHKASLAYFNTLKNHQFVGINLAYTKSKNNYKRDVGRPLSPDETPGDSRFVYDNSLRLPFQNNAVSAPFLEFFYGIRDKKWAEELKLTLIASSFYKELPQLPLTPVNQSNLTAMHTFADDKAISPVLNYKGKFLHDKLSAQAILGFSYNKTSFTDTSTNLYDRKGDFLQQKSYGRGELSTNGFDLHLRYKMWMSRFYLKYAILPNQQLQFSHIYSYNTRIGQDTLSGRTKLDGNDIYETPSTYKKNIAALGLQSTWLAGKLENILAVKYYRMETNGYSTYGNGGGEHLAGDKSNTYGFMEGISFLPTANWRLKVSYEQTTRLPDDFEVFGNSYSIKSNFGIQPEKSHNFNAQLYYTTTKTATGQFSISANYFSRNTGARIMLTRDIPFSYYKNRFKVISKGLELDLSYQPNALFLISANGTYLDVREDIRTEVERNENYKPDRIGDVSPLLGNIHVRFFLKNLIHKNSMTEVYGYWNYMHRFSLFSGAQDKLGLFEKFPPDYANAQFWIPYDGRLGQQQLTVGTIHHILRRKASVAVECNNVTDQKLFDNFYMLRPGRAFSVKLAWQW